LAVTLKLTVLPPAAVWLTGWVVMAGAMPAGLTVRTAPLLVAPPAELVAVTE